MIIKKNKNRMDNNEITKNRTKRRENKTSRTSMGKGSEMFRDVAFFGTFPPPPIFKGPSRIKNATETEFGTGNKLCYGSSKTLRRGLRNVCFYGCKDAGKRFRKEAGKRYRYWKLRRWQNIADSSAVHMEASLGYVLHPHIIAEKMWDPISWGFHKGR